MRRTNRGAPRTEQRREDGLRNPEIVELIRPLLDQDSRPAGNRQASLLPKHFRGLSPCLSAEPRHTFLANALQTLRPDYNNNVLL